MDTLSTASLSSNPNPDTGVYAIRNTVNGKVYVGSAARSFAIRWRAHVNALRAGKHHSRYLQRAWIKYGEAAFEFVILEQCPAADCLSREQHWIDDCRAAVPQHGYNGRPAAGSQLGFRHTPETRAKMAAANRARSPESRARHAALLRGRKLGAQTRAKMSASRKGRPKTSEHKAKIRQSNQGRNRSSETKARVTAALYKRFSDPEEREKLKMAQRRRYAKPEEREKMSAATRAAMARPEVKARTSEGLRRHFSQPGEREKQSERIRQLWADPEYRRNMLEARRKSRERRKGQAS